MSVQITPTQNKTQHPLTNDEKEKLLRAGQFGSKDQILWTQICDEVKAARDGRYPSDWTPLVFHGVLFTERGDNKVDPPELVITSIHRPKNTE